MLNKVLTAFEEEEIAVAGVQSIILKLFLFSLRLAWVLADSELAAIAFEIRSDGVSGALTQLTGITWPGVIEEQWNTSVLVLMTGVASVVEVQVIEAITVPDWWLEL